MSLVERIQENLVSAWTTFFPPPRYGYKQEKREPMATTAHIVIFGLSIVMVGFNCFWSTGLSIGYYPFLGATLIAGSCTVALSCCLAEMTSALPFSGGIYGFVRLTLGPLLGFIVGIFEIFQAVVYSAYYMVQLGLIVTSALHVDRLYSPIVWLLFSAFSAFLNIRGNHCFWNFQWLLTVFSVVVLLVFIFSAIQSADTAQYIHQEDRPKHFSNDADRLEGIFRYFFAASWFFSGFEMIPLTCSDAIEPKKTVAHGIIWQVLIVFVFAPVVITAACVQQPGSIALSEEPLPLIYGFMNNFHMSSNMASLLFVPALLQSYHACVYVFGRQLRSMADSRLLPAGLQTYHAKHRTPYIAILVGSAISYCLMFLRLFSEYKFEVLAGVSSIGTVFIYLLIACSFFIFRQRYPTLERHFVNPFGVVGSVYALLIVLFGLVGMVAFVSFGYLLVSFFFLLVFVASLYYFFYARHKQRFSEDEQKIFFLAYVINANRGKTKAMNKRSKSMYIQHEHNSTTSTSFRSNRRISDSSATNTRIDQSHRGRVNQGSPENSVGRMARISSPKSPSISQTDSHGDRFSSPPPVSPVKLLQDGDQHQASQDNLSVDTKYTLVENLFTITEENNGLKLDNGGSLDEADTQPIMGRDLVLESVPSSMALVDDWKSPRGLLSKKLSGKKLVDNAPLAAEDPTAVVADLPAMKKPISVEMKRKMMVLKLAAFGGFKDRAMGSSNKNRVTLPPIESGKYKADMLPKVFEDEHMTEFPSMEHVIAKRKSLMEQQLQQHLKRGDSGDGEADPDVDKNEDQSYLHKLENGQKSASMFRRRFGGSIMSSIKVLSSMKVMPFVNDPLFNQYTEEFVNARLGENEHIEQQHQQAQLEQMQRDYAFYPAEDVDFQQRLQAREGEDLEARQQHRSPPVHRHQLQLQHPQDDAVLTYDIPQELSEEHIPAGQIPRDLEHGGGGGHR